MSSQRQQQQGQADLGIPHGDGGSLAGGHKNDRSPLGRPALMLRSSSLLFRPKHKAFSSNSTPAWSQTSCKQLQSFNMSVVQESTKASDRVQHRLNPKSFIDMFTLLDTTKHQTLEVLCTTVMQLTCHWCSAVSEISVRRTRSVEVGKKGGQQQVWSGFPA